MKAKPLVLGILKYAIGFGLLAFVIWRSWGDKVQTNGAIQPGLRTTLQNAPDWTYFFLGAFLMVPILGLQYYRWYLLVRAVGLPITKRNTLRLGLVGTFYNFFLPGAIGGDLVKAYFIAQEHPARKPVAVATVLIDRILGLFGLVMIATLVGGISWARDEAFVIGSEYLKTIIRTTTITFFVIAIGWLLLGWMSEQRKNHIEERLHKLKPRRIGQTLAELWFAVRTYRQRSQVIYLSVLISIAAHICMVLLFFVCCRVFPLQDPAPFDETAVIAPVGYIAQVFFPVPGGVGGAEAIFGFLYSEVLHRPESTGVMGRLTLRVFEWAFGLVGYLMFLNMKKELQTDPAP